MRIPTLQNLISSLLEPTRIFIAILLAVMLWLLPAVIQPPINNTEKTRQPLQEAGGITLVSAIQANAPNCARECQYDECVNWKPGPSPICPRPGPGGGCCLAYETRCDPGCEDPTPPTLPPTISAVLNCSQYGNNGWCIGDLTLNLTASDPQGQSVTISGAVNGMSFPCTAGATTCSTSVLSEGARTITYRVDSATGLSAAGSTNYKLDSSLPSIGGNLNGVTGINGWYRSNVSLDVLASDLGSGVASVTASIDGGAVSIVSGPITFTDGIHSVEITVTDYAGFVNQASQIIRVDTITPTLSTSISGTSGLNGWYVSNVTITPSAGDAGSGLLALEVNADGAGYIPYTSPIVFTDGIHTYQFRAMDTAGNITETAQQTIQVDTVTPALSTSISGTSGLNGWYVSNVIITPSVSDSGSGLSAFVVSTDGSAYSTYINPVFFTEGVHTYRFRATDYAGNVTEITQQTIRVDTTTPSISLTITGTLGTNGWYISNVTVGTQVSDATSTVGSVEAVADGGAWSAASQLSLSDGLHTYQFRVTDQAGNSTTVPLQNIKIDTIAPFIDMTATLSLGETVYYEFQDNGSGLSFYRTVIEDDDERYQKVTWLDTLSGNKFKEDVLWDGKFADGTKAGWGEYFITLKVTDAAGNKAIKAAVVTVNPFSFLQDIPAFTPPNTTLPDPELQTESTPSTIPSGGFGGESNNSSAGSTVTTNEGGQNNPPSDGTTTTSTTGNTPNSFTDGAVLAGVGSASNHAGQTQPGNLLGTLGLVAAGTLAYETYRRRQEDEQQGSSSNNITPVVSSGGIIASPVRFGPPPPVEPTPPIDDEDDDDDDDKKDVVVTSTPNPYAPIPMPVPIAPGTPVIRRNPPLTQEQFETGMGGLVDSANIMVDHGTPSTLARVGLEVPVNASAVESTLIRSMDKVFGSFQDFLDDINLCTAGHISLGKVGLNVVERIDGRLGNASMATAFTSIAGNAMALMGIQYGQTVADVGTVSGAVVDAGSMVTGITRLIGNLTTGTAVPAAGVLAKVGGAIALPLGAITFGVEGYKATADYLDDGQLSRDGKASAWNAAGGLLTAVGGACILFVPGVGPIVGGILLAAGGVCSGVSWYVQHQQQVDAYVSNKWNAVKNIVNTTVTNVKNTVTQAINTAKTTAVKIVTKVTETVAKTVTKFTDTVKNTVTNTVKAVTETAKNAVTNTVKVVTNVAKNIVANTVKAVTEAPQNIVKAVTNTVKAVTEAPKNIVKAVTNTAKAVTETAKNTVKSIGNTISKWFKPKP